MAQERTDLPEPLVPGQGPQASQVPLTLPGPFPALRQCPDPGGESSLSREGSALPSWGPGQSELQQEGSRRDLHL